MVNYIDINDFAKVELRVGQVLTAERIPKADKLLLITVDIGEEKPRQILAGIAQYYEPEQLVGRKIVVVANLLRELQYSCQANRKTREGSNHPDRDAQFAHINAAAATSARQTRRTSVSPMKASWKRCMRNGRFIGIVPSCVHHLRAVVSIPSRITCGLETRS